MSPDELVNLSLDELVNLLSENVTLVAGFLRLGCL